MDSFVLPKDWLARASKHELAGKISEINQALNERYPRLEEPKYGKLMRSLNEKQLEVFFRNAMPFIRERFFFYTLYMYGLRISEGLKLNLEDVDLDSGVIKIHRSKSRGRIDFLPVSTAWAGYFEWFMDKFRLMVEAQGGFLFYSNSRGQQTWCSSYPRRVFRAVCEFPECRGNGLNKTYCQSKDGRLLYLKTVHSLKHSAGKRLCVRFGIRKAAEYLGHRDINSTAIYTKPSVEELRECGEFLDSGLSFVK